MDGYDLQLSDDLTLKLKKSETTEKPSVGNEQRPSHFRQLDPQPSQQMPPNSNSFSDLVRFVMGRPFNKLQAQNNPDNNTTTTPDTRQKDSNMKSSTSSNSVDVARERTIDAKMSQTVATQVAGAKKSCKAPPLPRRFGQICNCGQSNHNRFTTPNDSSPSSTQGSLPPVAYTSPLHLYDPNTKKCLPTSRNRDMLLKECHINHSFYPFLSRQSHSGSAGASGNYSKGNCYYDDLVCDPRKLRCICKPSLHLFYDNNLTTLGCMPVGPAQTSPDGRINCRTGYVYNVISKECQKVFDINDIHTGMSTTQYSFATIIIIWILLLILIVIAKLRKLRTSNMQYLYRNSSQSERRLHHGTGSHSAWARHHHGGNRSTWLHPFIAAVNGHHHLNQHRANGDRFAQSVLGDEAGNYNDTDFFLANGATRRLGDNNFTESQQSLNNPPPKFEEIYPSCPVTTTPPEEIETPNVIPPSNEDLPSYDEAMKLQNTIPPDITNNSTNNTTTTINNSKE